ncbi:MAG: serine/threonine protein kinase [Planctomycetales bacterium]|nr:serine/threonine protein kinase [Planctomycetales bacterium]
MTNRSYSTVPGATSQVEDQHWVSVALAVDELVEAWESYLAGNGPEPCIQEFLPADDEMLRRLALPELVKIDLEHRWHHNRSPRLMESYAEEFPELGAPGKLPAELIHEELQARMQAGQEVNGREIKNRFPEQATALLSLVGGMAVAGTPTNTYFSETKKESRVGSKIEPANEAVLAYEPGDKVDDFELLTLLGKGAFAQVFLARQVSLERLVALKISSSRGNEPKTLAQLDHPHVVRVFDQRQNADPPVHLLYMEVISGGTLLEVVKRFRKANPDARSGNLLLEAVDEMLDARGASRPTNSPSRNWLANASWPLVVCQIGAQLAKGLAYAHEKGVMHRDIKPANVLLTPEGSPKLADFNVSYNGGQADENPEDTFGGSLVYMSPEQLQACHPMLGGSPHLVRGASDVYSLGVLLWELLCGQRPYDEVSTPEGGQLAKIQRMIDERHYTDFTELAKQLPRDCPESLRQVLLRCLQPRKDERYKSAAEAAQALELCLYPHCWKLMQPPTNLLWRLIERLPLLSIVLAGLVPNALAGFFNFSYNRQRIEQGFPARVLERFDHVQLWVNGIVFPLGVVIGVWVALRIRQMLRPESPEDSQEAGSRVLFFGRLISLMVLGLWTVSGIIFPIATDLGFDLEGAVGYYSHFFMSLVLCGIVSMAYPYFLLTAIAVHSFFPKLVRDGVVTGPQWDHLQRLRSLNRFYLAMSALVPMLGVLVAEAAGSELRWALMVASGGGIVGFAAMFGLERFIDRDLNALERIALGKPRAAYEV